MKQIPSVVKKLFRGVDLMCDDWEIETFQEQLNWMLYDCNQQRDHLEEKSAKILEAMEAILDYKEERIEQRFKTTMGLYTGN